MGAMRVFALVFASRLAATVMATSSTTSVTPIDKVVVLLGDMKSKAEVAMKDEEGKFKDFHQWCADQKSTKGGEVAEEEALIEKLTAEIELGESSITKLDENLVKLKDQLGSVTKQMDKMTVEREEEANNYRATVEDLQEALDALTEAIKTLKAQSSDEVPNPASLLQVQKLLSLSPLEHNKHLTDFLQLHQDPVYEFKSGNIISMLDDLHVQFGKEKHSLDQKEEAQVHFFTSDMKSLGEEKSQVSTELGLKEKTKGDTAAQKAVNEGKLAETQKAYQEDSAYLADTKALCDLKKSDFEKRSANRAEEISTIGKVVEIISGKAVTGAKASLLSMNIKKGVAFVQLRGKERRSPQASKMAEFLEQQARLHGSRLLSQVAHSVQSDPFEKVMKMIKDLIGKLQMEASEESEQKGYCDKELKSNSERQEAKSQEKVNLETTIEELTASLAQLAQDASELSEQIQSLTEAMAKAASDRETFKAKNEETIKEAKAAQAAVQDALQLLKEFYEKSAESTAFTQELQQQPETWTTPYKGMQGESSGVMGLLEVIGGDFTRLEMETTTAEAQEAGEYKSYMSEASQDKALKETTKKHRESKKIDQESELQTTKEELSAVQTQLDKAKATYAKLKPMCVDTGITYEERKAQREAEIKSLEEAIRLLAHGN